MYYLVKVRFETIDERTGRPTTMYEFYLVEAIDISDAENKVKEKFKKSIACFSVSSIQESEIKGVLK
jgi:hypothetical protein